MSPAASEPALGASDRVACGVYAVAIAGVLFALDPAGTTLDRYHLPKEAILALGAVLIAALRAWESRAAGAPRLDAVDVAMVAWVGLGLVASIGVIDPDVASRATLLSGASAVLALDLRRRPARARRVVLVAALGATAASSLVVIAESYAVIPRISLATYAPGGTIGQRNNAAHVFAIAGTGLVGIAVTARSRRAVASSLLALAPIAVALVLTRSRVGWIAGAVGLVLAAVLGSIRGRAHAMRALAVLLVIVAASTVPVLGERPALAWRAARPYADTAERIVDVSDGSGRGRIVQWSRSMSLAGEQPLLGVGPGHWALHYPRIAEDDDETVHRDAWSPTSRLSTNDFLACLVERGPLALAALLVALALFARGRARTDPEIVAALAALVVVASLDCALQIATGALALALLAPPLEGDAPGPRVPAVIAALVLALALCGAPRAVVRAWSLARAERADLADLEAVAREDPSNVLAHVRLVEHFLYRRDCASARPHLRTLVRLRPYHPRIVDAARACGADP